MTAKPFVLVRSLVTLVLPMLVAGAWLAACEFNAKKLEDIECAETDPPCAAGYVCVDGYCVFDEDSQLVDPDVPELCGGTTRCLETQTCCDNACVDTAFEPLHCGGCGIACADGMQCNEGSCECQPEYEDCNGDPTDGCEVNLSGDVDAHCGACNNDCGETMQCVFGACVCNPGLLDCNNDPSADGCEADILIDEANCAACGMGCMDSESCSAGRCQCGDEPCAASETCCANSCVDTMRNSAHCGGCGMACRPGEVCEGGICKCRILDGGQVLEETCGAGERCCALGCSSGDTCPCGIGQFCTETQNCCEVGGAETCKNFDDSQHCGACGNACRNGEVCEAGGCSCNDPGTTFCQTGAQPSDGNCFDLTSNEQHCGACGNDCASGQSCCNGMCVDTQSDEGQCGGCLTENGTACMMGQECCGGTCRRLDQAGSCGSCTNDCTDLPRVATASCTGGNCGIASCDPGWRDCNGTVSDGCERNTNDDESHCGACNNACDAGEVCSNGVCTCGGVQCGAGAVCSNGECTCGGAVCGAGALCIDDQCICGGAGGQLCRDPDEGDHCEGNLCRCGGGDRCHQSSKVCSSGSCING